MSPAQLASINVNDLLNISTSTLGGRLLTIGNILNVNAADGVAALNTQINLLDLLNVATFQVANKQNFAAADVGIDLGPVGKVGLNLALIEPPQMAVGGVGGTGGVGATAKSAQLRLKIVINALTLAPGYSAVNVPLYVDLAPGQATLNTLQCNAPQSATFSVTTGVAEICMAKGQGADTPLSCPDVSKAANRVDVIPGLLNLGIYAHLNNSQQTITMNEPLPTSQTVGSSFSSMLGSLIQISLIGAGLDILPGVLDWLLTAVLSGLGGLLYPILTGVGSLLDAVSSLLGLHVGQSTVNLYSINCGSVKLVY
jgi:uncharacterized membrane protein